VKNSKKILILNTGGTFNKIYNPIKGSLVIYKNNTLINSIIKSVKIDNVKVEGLIYKDSLDITTKDRINLVKYIKNTKCDKILIIHGTDTMNLTALYLENYINDKQIVLTGAMIPFSIDQNEAIANLMMGYGFLKNCIKNNIYISMHGEVVKHNKIKKNKELGLFECH
jgi:L-asparaginase